MAGVIDWVIGKIAGMLGMIVQADRWYSGCIEKRPSGHDIRYAWCLDRLKLLLP